MVDLTEYDNKIRMVIGNLLRRAEPIPKSVLSAFGPSKDRHINKSVLEVSPFTATSLEAFANFLNIQTHDSDRIKLFSSKTLLANRICLEIQSLFPVSCGECSEEYSVKCDSENPPALRCVFCFQCCHDRELKQQHYFQA